MNKSTSVRIPSTELVFEWMGDSITCWHKITPHGKKVIRYILWKGFTICLTDEPQQSGNDLPDVSAVFEGLIYYSPDGKIYIKAGNRQKINFPQGDIEWRAIVQLLVHSQNSESWEDNHTKSPLTGHQEAFLDGKFNDMVRHTSMSPAMSVEVRKEYFALDSFPPYAV